MAVRPCHTDLQGKVTLIPKMQFLNLQSGCNNKVMIWICFYSNLSLSDIVIRQKAGMLYTMMFILLRDYLLLKKLKNLGTIQLSNNKRKMINVSMVPQYWWHSGVTQALIKY